MIFNCEIKRAPEYPEDWQDYELLGLSVFGCYCDWLPENQRWQVFTEDNNFAGVQDLIDQAEIIVGFNSLSFDDRLCKAHGINIATTFDLMVEVRRAVGQPLSGPCTRGYKLLHIAESNLGANSPEVLLKEAIRPGQVPDLWRLGEREKVITYCLNEVFLTFELYKRRRKLVDPVRHNRLLHCDPDSRDWREIRATIKWFLAEQVFSFSVDRVSHWRGVDILKARLAIAESAVLTFPVWIFPQHDWRVYTGLPFRLTSQNSVKTDRQRELDVIYKRPTDSEGEDADPIPF
jgi:hypothetical protein